MTIFAGPAGGPGGAGNGAAGGALASGAGAGAVCGSGGGAGVFCAIAGIAIMAAAAARNNFMRLSWFCTIFRDSTQTRRTQIGSLVSDAIPYAPESRA
jgi:hypothetical protein